LRRRDRHFSRGDIAPCVDFPFFAVAGLGFTALAAASPAQAAFHVIRWHDTGFCQIWDNSLPTAPWPVHYTTVTHRLHTFGHALEVKEVLLRKGTCTF
jgi:hypothetical protein